MNEISRHIEILLLDNDCVIVPGFGGFMAHHKPAEYVAEEGMFYPPQRTLGFNPQLQLNDSLLAQSYVEAYDISYPEAVKRIEEEVEEIRQRLSVDGEYEFHGIGTIILKADNHYDFSPCTAGLLTPTLYALNSYAFDMLSGASIAAISIPVKPVEGIVAAETAAIEAGSDMEMETDEEEGALRISLNTLRYVATAAIFLMLFIFSSIPAGRGSSNVNMCSVIDTELISSLVSGKKAATSMSGSMQTPATSTAEASADSVAQSPAQAETTNETPRKHFAIVLASKVSKAGADDYVARLKAEGYDKAGIYERGSMRKVVYGNYATETEAANDLRQMRDKSSGFAEAWISEMHDN